MEQQRQNEVMRHVPTLSSLKERVSRNYRPTAETLYSSAYERGEKIPTDVETGFRALVHCIEKLSESIRHTRSGGHNQQQQMGKRLSGAFDQALVALNSIHEDEFGRRAAFHSFERSQAEALFSSILMIGVHLERLTVLVGTLDPDLHERLLAHAIRLEHPVNEQVLRPIA
ncbi:MAG TPA: hypothetical protein VNM92_07365 [Thermoanaerobaculia bacterium]|nr:hypothetical protein [Thermoanaerobaculia bacterium]